MPHTEHSTRRYFAIEGKMQTVGNYRYSSTNALGRGAYAIVYRGQDITTSQQVAVKSLKKFTYSSVTMHPSTRVALLDEIAVSRELSTLRHENIVQLLDRLETSKHVYLIMEYCNGGTLAQYLSNNGALSEETIKVFAQQLSRAMQALHLKHVVHRDLKPQNVLLTCTTRCPSPHEIVLKLCDFGMAIFLEDGKKAHSPCGTPNYMAVEVLLNKEYDAKIDLWAFGVIMHHCLTRSFPFGLHESLQNLKRFHREHPVLEPHIPLGISSQLAHLLRNLLQQDPANRMNFGDFFAHPFLADNPKASSSSPDTPSDWIAVSKLECQASKLAETQKLTPDVNQTFRKLCHTRNLVECINGVAMQHNSPFSQIGSNYNKNLFSRKRREQIMLYTRSLQLLSSALKLAKNEVEENRLIPSAEVKETIVQLRNLFKATLEVVKVFRQNISEKDLHNCCTVEQILYQYAMRLCLNSAMDEFFGLTEGCRKGYQSAQTLIQFLSSVPGLSNEDSTFLQNLSDKLGNRLSSFQQPFVSSDSFEYFVNEE